MLRRKFMALLSAMVPAWFVRTREANATELTVAVEPKQNRVGYLWSEIPEQYRRDGVWFAKHKCADDSGIMPVHVGSSTPDDAACLWKLESCKRADLVFLMRFEACNYGWSVGPKGIVKEPSSGWQGVSVEDKQKHVGVVHYWADEGPPVTEKCQYVVVFHANYMLLEIHRVTDSNPLPPVDETAFLDWYDTYGSARRHASKELMDRIPKADPLEFMKLVDLAIEHGLWFDNQVFAEAVALRQAYLGKA